MKLRSLASRRLRRRESGIFLALMGLMFLISLYRPEFAAGGHLYLVSRQIAYAIPYAKEPATCLDLANDGRMFTDKGVPICRGGLAMQRHQKDKQGRQVYICPVKRGTHVNGKYTYVAHVEDCPLKCLCEPNSSTGPIVHVHKDIDPRIHPQIPRDSEQYRRLLASRTCTERSNSAKKEAYRMSYTNTRVMSYAYIKLALISLLEHSRVWAAELLEQVPKHLAITLFM